MAIERERERHLQIVPDSNLRVFPDPQLSNHMLFEPPHSCNMREMVLHRKLDEERIKEVAIGLQEYLDTGFKFMFDISKGVAEGEEGVNMEADTFRLGFQGPRDYIVYTGVNELFVKTRTLSRIAKTHLRGEEIYRASLKGEEVIWPEIAAVVVSSDPDSPSEVIFVKEHPALRVANNEYAVALVKKFTAQPFLWGLE